MRRRTISEVNLATINDRNFAVHRTIPFSPPFHFKILGRKASTRCTVQVMTSQAKCPDDIYYTFVLSPVKSWVQNEDDKAGVGADQVSTLKLRGIAFRSLASFSAILAAAARFSFLLLLRKLHPFC